MFSLNQLDFEKIKLKLLNYAFNDFTREKVNHLSPISNFDEVIKMTNQTNVLLEIIAKYGQIPFIYDFDDIFLNDHKIIFRNYSINEFILLKKFLEMEENIINYFKQFLDDKKEKLAEIINFENNSSLLRKINMIFDYKNEIKDDASIELKKIRNIIRKLELNLKESVDKLILKYKNILSENVVVIRNDRFCLPVRDFEKNKIKGIIHDVSASGHTIFIEPAELLEITSIIELNKILEEKEILKILAILSGDVNLELPKLKKNLKLFLELDFLNTKASYSLEINGILPNLNNSGKINIIKGYHPLLNKKIAVPIDINIDNLENILFITGPNTGGKTVALKTVGIFSLMIQSGILIPASSLSDIAVFDNILADIGDLQSIENSLSSFSSHITNIIMFLQNFSNNSLILLDEIGSGTDPLEGVALAIAIIEEFNKKDVRMIVTTHYLELKLYGLENKGIKLASVAFDENTLKPLYYLEYGISNNSHARLISRRLGLQNNIINRADELYFNTQSNLSKIIEKIDYERNVLKIKNAEIAHLKEKLNHEIQEFKRKENDLIRKQNEIIELIKLENEEKMKKKNAELDEIIEKIRLENQIKQHHLTKLKDTSNAIMYNNSLYKRDFEFEIGEIVFIKKYLKQGKIIGMKNNKFYVEFGNLKFYFSPDELDKVEEKKLSKKIFSTKKMKQKENNYTLSNSLSVDLRGKRYDDVKFILDKEIDRAILSNFRNLTIIHGFGTGAIRNAVLEYIKKSPMILSSRFGDESEGAAGVTIITLK